MKINDILKKIYEKIDGSTVNITLEGYSPEQVNKIFSEIIDELLIASSKIEQKDQEINTLNDEIKKLQKQLSESDYEKNRLTNKLSLYKKDENDRK
ncbi:hypothetical protein ACXYRQ_03630 [Mycoplasma sp. 394]|uniref:hypothetical protein n=1 Tax=Mycoplasma sp. 6243 TaxID=3440865 RepID=UPI003EBA2C79